MPPAAGRSSPGSTPQTELHAGVYSKDDEVGNCREFTHLLRKEAARGGVRFRFDTQVELIVAGARPILVVAPRRGDPRDEAGVGIARRRRAAGRRPSRATRSPAN